MKGKIRFSRCSSDSNRVGKGSNRYMVLLTVIVMMWWKVIAYNNSKMVNSWMGRCRFHRGQIRVSRVCNQLKTCLCKLLSVGYVRMLIWSYFVVGLN